MRISIYGTGVHIGPLGLSQHEREVLMDLERIKGKPAARLMNDVFLMNRIGLGRIHEPIEITTAKVQLDAQLRVEVRYGSKRRRYTSNDVLGEGWLIPPFKMHEVESTPLNGAYRFDHGIGHIAAIELGGDSRLEELEVMIDRERMVWELRASGFDEIYFPEVMVRRRGFNYLVKQ